MNDARTIVKVGGSLYDLPDLRERLNAWLLQASLSRILLVPGGGITAQAIREFDRVHRLGEEASHWLAIQSLTVNAHFLKELLPIAQIVAEIPAAPSSWCILDPYPFFRADESRADHLPHHWQVTSDSLAVRVAELGKARELILMKSADWQGTDWSAAKSRRLVDGFFPEAVRKAPASLAIRIVNLRAAIATWRSP